MLRCSQRETELLVCRIPDDIADKMGLRPPEAAAAETSSSSSMSTSTSSSSHPPNHWLSPVLPLSALGVRHEILFFSSSSPFFFKSIFIFFAFLFLPSSCFCFAEFLHGIENLEKFDLKKKWLHP